MAVFQKILLTRQKSQIQQSVTESSDDNLKV